MAHFFAVLLAAIQAATTASPTPPTLDPRWVVTFESAPVTTPGYDANSAYVPLKDGQLIAVGLDGGAVRWRVDVATPHTPATGDGMVFVATDQAIEARDAQSGAVQWRTPLSGATIPPFYNTGWLIASTGDGELLALRGADGQVIWRRKLGASLSSRPGAALDRLYLPLDNNQLLSIRLETGDVVWERALPGPASSVLALDDQLLVGTTAKRLMSIDLRNGRERWGWTVGGDISGMPAADEKRIYFAARDNVLRAVDRGNGNLRWKANLPSRPAGGPLRLPDTLLMPMVSTEMQSFEPETGKTAAAVRSAGEIGAQPFFRAGASLTSPRLIAVSREGQLQGFARRFEPPMQPLPVPLIGAPALP